MTPIRDLQSSKILLLRFAMLSGIVMRVIELQLKKAESSIESTLFGTV